MQVINEIYSFYKNSRLKKGVIGKSVDGRDIFYVFVGKHSNFNIISQYSIHAREWVTSYLALKQIEYLSNQDIDFGIYFIPLANPDGVALATNGIDSIKNKTLFLLKNKALNFKLFKANANGVDLNVNFDANWSQGVQNIFTPAAENYVGLYPFSEPETRAIRDFTLKVKPNLTLSYHTKGEEIYWFFGQNKRDKLRDFNLAKVLSDTTSYPLKQAFGSVGGYKDWCIQKLKIPSFTLEVGSDKLPHPINLGQLDVLFNQNRDVFLRLYQAIKG